MPNKKTLKTQLLELAAQYDLSNTFTPYFNVSYKNPNLGKWVKNRTILELVDYANQVNPNFIKRMKEPNLRYIEDKEGNAMSHKLAYATDDDNNAIVYPLIQEIDGLLLQLSDKEAYDNALKNNNYLVMTPDEAKIFTNNTYKLFYPSFEPFINTYKQGGEMANYIEVEINNKIYKLKEAKTPEERAKGLSNINNLPKNEGMIFYYDSPRKVSYWMKDTNIPLDIIFVDEDDEVISVANGKPNSEEPMTESNVKLVIELNADSGIKKGDEVEFEDDEDNTTMKVLSLDGSSQMDLEGGERIISRRETKILIRKAKQVYKFKDTDKYKNKCKSLGKYIFKVIDGQENRDPEYVENKNKKD